MLGLQNALTSKLHFIPLQSNFLGTVEALDICFTCERKADSTSNLSLPLLQCLRIPVLPASDQGGSDPSLHDGPLHDLLKLLLSNGWKKSAGGACSEWPVQT